MNVKDFGAIGDGVTDDATAIQSAIDSCSESRKVLFFPMGTYLINTTLQLKSNVVIKGENVYESIILIGNDLTVGINYDKTSDKGALSKNIGIECIAIKGTNENTQTGLYFNGLHYKSYIKNIILDHLYDGIYIKSAWYGYIENVHASWITRYGIELESVDGSNQVNALPIKRFQQDGGQTGIYAHGLDSYGIGLYISECIFEHTESTAIIIDAVRNVSIENCYFEVCLADASFYKGYETPIAIALNQWSTASISNINNISIATGTNYNSNEVCAIYVNKHTNAIIQNVTFGAWNRDEVENFYPYNYCVYVEEGGKAIIENISLDNWDNCLKDITNYVDMGVFNNLFTNLLINSSDYSGDSWNISDSATVLDEVYKGSKIVQTRHGWSGARYYIAELVKRGVLTPRKTYTFSAYVRSTSSQYLPDITFYSTNYYLEPATQSLGVLSTTWKRVSATFIVYDNIYEIDPNDTETRLRIEAEADDSSWTGYFQMCGFSLVEGDTAPTEWGRNPLDIDKDISNATTSSGYQIWSGTQAEYDAITTKNPTTIYLIKGE